MTQRISSLAASVILATLCYIQASIIDSQPKFVLEAENNKAFGISSLVKTFDIQSGNIAECLQQCLQDCRCQSFQICQNTKCQLCSSHKVENSSLLHDEDGCVYATYKIGQPTKTIQKLEEQCLDTSCALKYNCCQQAGVCPKNKICKPFHSPTKPWKRFTCECRDGYYGENCDKRIRSCAGYSDVRKGSGKYKVFDSKNSEYEVYCHFDSDGAWTLVQSYSYSRRNEDEFKTSLAENKTANEDAQEWDAYRLSKSRMESIKNTSTFLQFTCNYKKHRAINESDYVQIELQSITKNSPGGKKVDVLKLNTSGDYTEASSATAGNVRGKIGDCDLGGGQIKLAQNKDRSLHVHLSYGNSPDCSMVKEKYPRFWTKAYFGSYLFNPTQNHSCIQDESSTTQLWFGIPYPQQVN